MGREEPIGNTATNAITKLIENHWIGIQQDKPSSRFRYEFVAYKFSNRGYVTRSNHSDRKTGRIQFDRVLEMQKWAGNIKSVENERIKFRHFAGFGPGTANVFRNMLGLSEAKWQEKAEGHEQEQQYPSHDSKQSTISDFLS